MENESQCVIGLYYRHDGCELVTLQDLKRHIGVVKEFNKTCRQCGMDFISKKEYTLRDYTDKRKYTNLTRFDFCPLCGKKIDWKAIRRADDG